MSSPQNFLRRTSPLLSFPHYTKSPAPFIGPNRREKTLTCLHFYFPILIGKEWRSSPPKLSLSTLLFLWQKVGGADPAKNTKWCAGHCKRSFSFFPYSHSISSRRRTHLFCPDRGRQTGGHLMHPPPLPLFRSVVAFVGRGIHGGIRQAWVKESSK